MKFRMIWRSSSSYCVLMVRGCFTHDKCYNIPFMYILKIFNNLLISNISNLNLALPVYLTYLWLGIIAHG